AAERTLPPGGGAHLEIEAGLAACRHAVVSESVVRLDELLLVGTFIRRPPAELQIVPLDKGVILSAMRRTQSPREGRNGSTSGVRHRGAVSDTSESLF